MQSTSRAPEYMWLDPPQTAKLELEYSSWLADPKPTQVELPSTVFELLPTPALIVNADGLVAACNRAAAALAGCSAVALVGHPWWLLLTPDDPVPQPPDGAAYTLRTRAGDRHVAVRKVPLEPPASAPVMLLLDELAPAGSTGVANDGSFLLEVAHELRSHLLSFNLALGGLAQPEPHGDGDERRLVSSLQRSAVHLQTLLENMLDAASIGASRFSVLRRETDLVAVLQEAILVVEPLLRSSHQSISVEFPEAMLTISADAQRLRQVIVNLLHNAIKYGSPQAGITVRAMSAGSAYRVEVSDRGPGIPLEEQPYLFDRFYRGRKARNEGRRGTGLGLAIARAIVQAHGGEIGVESKLGDGTTFWFSVPAV